MDLKTRPRRAAVRGGVVGLLRGFVQRSVLRPYLYLAGMIHLRRGRLAAAESCLCRAALINPRHFATRVQLGRVYFLMDEFFKAEQQFTRAQQIDPERFRRDHLVDQDAGWADFEPDPDSSERGFFGDYDAQASFLAYEEGPGEGGAPEPAPADDTFRYGDFSSYEEWQRLRGLPPITRAEIARIDWDRFFSDPTQ